MEPEREGREEVAGGEGKESWYRTAWRRPRDCQSAFSSHAHYCACRPLRARIRPCHPAPCRYLPPCPPCRHSLARRPAPLRIRQHLCFRLCFLFHRRSPRGPVYRPAGLRCHPPAWLRHWPATHLRSARLNYCAPRRPPYRCASGASPRLLRRTRGQQRPCCRLVHRRRQLIWGVTATEQLPLGACPQCPLQRSAEPVGDPGTAFKPPLRRRRSPRPDPPYARAAAFRGRRGEACRADAALCRTAGYATRDDGWRWGRGRRGGGHRCALLHKLRAGPGGLGCTFLCFLWDARRRRATTHMRG